MRRVLSFLVWLFSFWTWKDFFLRWLRSPASYPDSGETSEHLPSQERQPESKLASFLSSLPEDKRRCDRLEFYGDSEVRIRFGSCRLTLSHGTGVEASYREFLEAVASSEIVFREELTIVLNEDGSCKHVEAFGEALRQSGDGIRKLGLGFWGGSPVRFAKCVSSVLVGNDGIQDLRLGLGDLKEVIGREVAAEVIANIVVPRNLRILKSFEMWAEKLDEEGMEQLMKPFQGPPSVLENLQFEHITSDAQLEHINGILASSTSLKKLYQFFYYI